MTELEAAEKAVATLTYQLRLAVQYMRDHVADDPYIDDNFLLRFATVCEEIIDENIIPTTLEKYFLLDQLNQRVYPWFNLYDATGESDPFFKEKIRETLDSLRALGDSTKKL